MKLHRSHKKNWLHKIISHHQPKGYTWTNHLSEVRPKLPLPKRENKVDPCHHLRQWWLEEMQFDVNVYLCIPVVHLSICVSLYLPLDLSILLVCLSSACISVYLSFLCLSIFLFNYLYFFVPIYVCIFPSISPSRIYLLICLSTYPSIYLSIYPSIYLQLYIYIFSIWNNSQNVRDSSKTSPFSAGFLPFPSDCLLLESRRKKIREAR